MNRERMLAKRDFWLGVLVVVGVTLYRPLTFWASNAWDLSTPQDVLMTGGLELALAVALLLVGRVYLNLRAVSLSLLIGATFFVLFNWHTIGVVAPALWLLVLALLALTLDRLASAPILNGVALVSIVVLLVAPTVALVVAHIDQRVSYPILRSEQPDRARASGEVEDVLVLVVDSYPTLNLAEAWFDHDTSTLKRRLKSQGFTTPTISWSQNTVTSLAVPSIMELSQVVDDQPKGDWGNRKDSYDIARGDSFAVTAFRKAGFQITHVESGWNGGTCRNADQCMAAPWYEGTQSLLLSTSILSYPLTTVLGNPFVTTSVASIDQLRRLEVFGDGQLDYVYAHSLLPHSPFIVDSTCSVRQDTTQHESTLIARVREQLECADRLLLKVVGSIPDETAVLITGDHGPATNGQLTKDEATWSDSDIAERLGVLLAYRFPSSCEDPDSNTNVSAMRALTNCALDVEGPSDKGGFFIGSRSPQEVAPSRITTIEEKLRSSALGGD